MNWNKTEIFGDNILLMGAIITNTDSDNHQATKLNMKELEGVIMKLQQLMLDNEIDAVNVTWSGTKLLKQKAQKVNIVVNDNLPN